MNSIGGTVPRVTLLGLSLLGPSLRSIEMDSSCCEHEGHAHKKLWYRDRLLWTVGGIGLLFIAVFLLNGLLGLFFLERLTGPLTRVQKVLKEIGKGRIPSTDIQLRQADFPKELAKALSEVIVYLKKK